MCSGTNIPDIISIFLRYVCQNYYSFNDRTIFACLQVNSTWAAEGIKHLWRHCGDGSADEQLCSKSGPAIVDLVVVNQKRQQEYANCIRNLSFGAVQTKMGPNCSPKIWEGRFITDLQHLVFPGLEKLEIHGNLPLSQFLQPRLKSLIIEDPYNINYFALSNSFLTNVSQSCQGLRNLSLNFNETMLNQPLRNTALADTLCLLLQNLSQITNLSFTGSALMGAMSSSAFRHIAGLKFLRALRLLDIANRWTRDLSLLEHNYEQTFFTQLQELDIGAISDHALKALSPYITRVQTLILTQHNEEMGLFSIIAGIEFGGLRKLHLNLLSDASLFAIDLLSFARKAPMVEILKLLPKPNAFLRPVDITDNTLQEIIRNLPNLTELSMRLNSSELTGATLLSLGKYCPLLRSCDFSALINYENIIHSSSATKWLSLEQLTITPPREPGLEELYRQSHSIQLATEILKAMPKLIRANLDWNPPGILDLSLQHVISDRQSYGNYFD